jgi:hypothetical protein
VTDGLTVQGAVLSGATVRSGGHLVVQGAFAGPLTIEDGASVNVQGSFHGDIQANGGLLLLYGEVGLDFRPGVGRVVVGSNSVLTGAGAHMLRPDGTVEALPPGTYGAGTFNVQMDRVCAYLEHEDRFVPVDLKGSDNDSAD